MIKIDVRMDLESLRKRLAEIDDGAVKFATAAALTWTAKDAQEEIKREMRRVFDRPTPFTLNSTFIKPATKRDLASEVGIKDWAVKGRPAIEWLGPEIYGGGRSYKRLETLLQNRGILPAGMYVVPGAGARLNAYGNMSTGQIQQILAGVGAARDVLQRATTRSRKRNAAVKSIFALRTAHGSLRPGIYQKQGGHHLSPLLIFVQRPSYHARLGFDQIVQRIVRERFEVQFKRAAALAELNVRPSLELAA